MAAGWAGLPAAVAMPLLSGDDQHGALTLVECVSVAEAHPILFPNGGPVVVARRSSDSGSLSGLERVSAHSAQ
eukprot:4459911-Pleurochrysis_carterae.AAC.2